MKQKILSMLALMFFVGMNSWAQLHLPITPGGNVSVSLDKTSLTLTVGESETVTASITGGVGVMYSSWSVTGEADCISLMEAGNVATVTAQKAGTATITFRYSDKTATCIVTVAEPAAAIFAIDTDGTTQDFGSVEADATAQKTFTITNSGNKSLYVTISNPEDFTAEMTHNDNANVYFTDALGWGDIHVYYWPNGPEWPGAAMTELYTNELGQKVYYYELPADVEGVIFNGNGNQTGDITDEPIGKAYYTKDDNTVGTWSYNNCVPAGMSRVLTVTMNTATLGSKSGNITLSFDAKNATSFTIPCTGKTVAPVTNYNVTLAEGTEDADNWTITPNPAEEGQTVTITYSGTKKVKSVKAVKK